MADRASGMVLLSGNSHPELSRLVAERLGIPLGDAVVYNNTSSETTVNIKESVRSKHVFILQTGTKNVNNDVMELLILIYACRTSTAKSITVVIPYLPYSKQCRVVRRSSIAIKLIADLIDKTGACRVVSMDLYKKELQGFFSIPVDNLRASHLIIPFIKQNISDFKNAVIVAKNPEVLPKAASYSEKLKCGVAVIHGTYSCDQQSASELASAESGNTDQSRTPMNPPLSLVGDVSGKIAIVVDNIIDEAHSFVEAAELLKSRGAYKIFVVGTHGLLSGDAPAIIEDSHITQVIVTNTVPHDLQKMRSHKIRTVDISTLLCEAIRRIYHNESMGILFRDTQESSFLEWLSTFVNRLSSNSLTMEVSNTDAMIPVIITNEIRARNGLYSFYHFFSKKGEGSVVCPGGLQLLVGEVYRATVELNAGNRLRIRKLEEPPISHTEGIIVEKKEYSSGVTIVVTLQVVKVEKNRFILYDDLYIGEISMYGRYKGLRIGDSLQCEVIRTIKDKWKVGKILYQYKSKDEASLLPKCPIAMINRAARMRENKEKRRLHLRVYTIEEESKSTEQKGVRLQLHIIAEIRSSSPTLSVSSSSSSESDRSLSEELNELRNARPIRVDEREDDSMRNRRLWAVQAEWLRAKNAVREAILEFRWNRRNYQYEVQIWDQWKQRCMSLQNNPIRRLERSYTRLEQKAAQCTDFGYDSEEDDVVAWRKGRIVLKYKRDEGIGSHLAATNKELLEQFLVDSESNSCRYNYF